MGLMLDTGAFVSVVYPFIMNTRSMAPFFNHYDMDMP